MAQVLEDRPTTYCIIARRFADLQAEVAAIFRPRPEVQVILDRRMRDRRRVRRPVETERRIGMDLRLS
ncbi:MAG: hypothetical protein ACE5JU_19220 [Candidatus Binatia bacterium]